MQQQVLDLLIEQLGKIVEAQENQPRLKPSHESDVRLPDLAQAVLGSRPEGHEEWRPLYDAAWDLCRIGVLRPGEIAPRGMSAVSRLGDYYSITDFGRQWLKTAAARPFLHQSHMNDVLQSSVRGSVTVIGNVLLKLSDPIKRAITLLPALCLARRPNQFYLA